MTREILDQFQGKRNVTKYISNNGLVSYLTQSRSFADEASSLGACKLNTIENKNKHVLFLFNKNDEEVGRYYIGKKLQGKTPSEIAGIKHNLVFFDSWNPNTKEWVPCVGMKINRFITFNDIKDFERKSYSLSWGKLEEIFNLVVKDGEIEYSEENIKTLKHWVKFNRTIFIDDHFNVEGSYLAHIENSTELERKLLFWTTIIKEGYWKNFKEEELHYNEVNLNKLHYFVANRTRRPKKVIDGESEIMGALKSGNGDAFGF